MTNVLDKIRKLLRLAKDKGATENEQMVALQMAQRLMLQHNIQDVEEEKHIEAVKGEWMNVDRGDPWEITAAHAVATLFNCRSLFVKLTGAHQFVGKPENVEICGDVFLWVCSQIEVLYKETLRSYSGRLDKTGRADLRKTFKFACAQRVYWRCVDIAKTARNDLPSHLSLVVVDQSLAAADDLIKDVRKRSVRAPRAGIGTIAGNMAGDRVKLQGEVTGSHRQICNK